MSKFVFETLPRIVCEQGAAEHLAAEVGALGAGKVLIVTDVGLAQRDVVQAPMRALRDAGIAVELFADVRADPDEACVRGAADAARRSEAQCVIGLGGGSSLDTAKLAALLAATPQALEDIYGAGKARGPRLPLIQVPTTAGTGSEATPTAVVSTPDHQKRGVISPVLYPDVALLDSLLTLGLPPAITAMTGIDAMVHAIEATTTRQRKNPISDALALSALRRLYANLPRVVADGADADAREQMLLGSLQAGMAFANAPVGAVHALASALGARHHLPHGLSNALVLLPVLRFNLPWAAPHYAAIGRALEPGRCTPDDGQAAAVFIDAMAALLRGMPIAQSLAEAGVPADDIERLADEAMRVGRLLDNNIRPVSRADARDLFAGAFTGSTPIPSSP